MAEKNRLKPIQNEEIPSSSGRRSFLITGAAAGAGSLLLRPGAVKAADKTRTSARIVIAGAGAAGLTTASFLSQRLEGAKITLIDAQKEHFYQPGFTLVASGIKPAAYTASTTAEYVPKGVELVKERVVEFDPEGNRVVTNSGKTYPYDFLIVATGLKLDYEAIEGMDVNQLGRNGLGSIYHSHAGAAATWQALSEFADKGGVGVFCRPNTEMKCAGAPLKYTFVADDYLRLRGNRNKGEIIYNSNNQVLFSVPIVSEKVRMLFKDRGIKTYFDRTLEAVDIGKRTATFKTPEGNAELQYDFINVIPPMRASDAVRNSPLPWKEGIFAHDGWMEVHKGNLRHKRFENVFGIGDAAGVPKGKTAASVKWQVPVAMDHLIASINGKESKAVYNGYTSCPMITRLGRAMLVEFDYDNDLVPSFPGIIAPLEELWITWIMKTVALKPTYISMLRGRT